MSKLPELRERFHQPWCYGVELCVPEIPHATAHVVLSEAMSTHSMWDDSVAEAVTKAISMRENDPELEVAWFEVAVRERRLAEDPALDQFQQETARLGCCEALLKSGATRTAICLAEVYLEMGGSERLTTGMTRIISTAGR